MRVRAIVDSANAALPKVSVLLALYQGERFLQQQLDSIAAQTDVSWDLVVSDDGSVDCGPQIIRNFANAFPGRVALQTGPGQGAVANFCALLTSVETQGYVALADQDDVWFSNKLARAVTTLATVPAQTPALYCSRVEICDAQLKPAGMSRRPKRPASFRHALVQNLVQGNTIVMNQTAKHLMQSALRTSGQIVMHDWFIYQIVSGAGGRVIYDKDPTLRYRQHDSNVVGANEGMRARLASIKRMLQGQQSTWSRQNIAALSNCTSLLTVENRVHLETFRQLVEGSVVHRLQAMWGGQFYRQGCFSQAALWLAAAIGRV
ncbi:MAG: glycosyltransferase family 2 protein [Pseudotabrizicola sp.]|nr:glycosyltransferase family 2 protein [Pseudotabrizicola sp.]